MSFGTRGATRARFLRRVALVAAALAILALLFLATSHWIIGLLLAVGAALAIWVLLQLRSVR